MKRNVINLVMTEGFEQLIATVKQTSIQFEKFVKENPVTKEVIEQSKRIGLALKEKYPEYSEIFSEAIRGQKEVFRDLFSKNSPSVSSSEKDSLRSE